jgi:hypothetical protein
LKRNVSGKALSAGGATNDDAPFKPRTAPLPSKRCTIKLKNTGG